tara:strand:+ start:1827 stop:2219 length:393 start_codon:yes stop_codon:yes gene_type:complete
MHKLMFFFAAGCIGALINSLVIWQFGQQGISQSLSVSITPGLTPHWIYPRIVWGGLWGLLFILPMLNSRLLMKGTVLSVFPTLMQLFVVLPMQAYKGIAGLDLGLFTILLVLFFNWVWGLSTALAIKFLR